MTTDSKKKICIALTYYYPYISGLSNVAKDVADQLVQHGHDVTVVATQHDSNLPKKEIVNGVKVVRTPVLFKLGKGTISPSFVPIVLQEARKADFLNLHLPLLEAGAIAIFNKTDLICTYHCDVTLEPTLVGRTQNNLIDLSSIAAIKRARHNVVTSLDYAKHSRLSSHLLKNCTAIPPTIHNRQPADPKFRDGDGFHFGFLGRIVEEKGLDVLVKAFSKVKNSSSRLLVGGSYTGVAGGSVVDKIRPIIEKDKRIKLLGFIPDSDVDSFYSSIDCFCLPSVNAFEAFGIVQVEAMLQGIPVIASDLPGVRQPVLNTKMGIIVEPGSVSSLSKAIDEIAAGQIDLTHGQDKAKELYSMDRTIQSYLSILNQ